MNMTWKQILLLFGIATMWFVLLPLVVLLFAADVEIDNAAATNITRVSAYFNGTVVNTNATNPTLTLYYGTSDAGTNAGSWQYTNAYGVASTGAVSTNITGLTPAQLYYYRWYALDTVSNQYDWADSTTNFWTTAGAPTSTAPAHSYQPVMVDTDGVLAAPTNFFSTNSVLGTNGFARDGSRTMLGAFLFNSGLGLSAYFGTDTSDGSDSGTVYYGAGGAWGIGRGAYMEVWGNEGMSGGHMAFRLGNVSGAAFSWYTLGNIVTLSSNGWDMGGLPIANASISASQFTGDITAARMTNALSWDGASDWTGTFGGNTTNYYRNAANQTGTLSNASVPIAQLTGGVTYNHSWVDNDGITNQVNYYNGAVTNIYTNGVSLIP